MAGLLGWHSIDNCDLPFLSVVQSVCMAGDSLRGLSIVDFAAPLLQERYTGKPCSL